MEAILLACSCFSLVSAFRWRIWLASFWLWFGTATMWRIPSPYHGLICQLNVFAVLTRAICPCRISVSAVLNMQLAVSNKHGLSKQGRRNSLHWALPCNRLTRYHKIGHLASHKTALLGNELPDRLLLKWPQQPLYITCVRFPAYSNAVTLFLAPRRLYTTAQPKQRSLSL